MKTPRIVLYTKNCIHCFSPHVKYHGGHVRADMLSTVSSPSHRKDATVDIIAGCCQNCDGKYRDDGSGYFGPFKEEMGIKLGDVYELP